MSESKYQPPVNMPENIPGNPTNPQSMIVQFLHSSGQWIGADASQLMLMPVKDGENDMVAFGYGSEGKFRELVRFPGRLTLEEKTIVIP